VTEDIPKLTRLFTELGARNPEQWAKSQAIEGLPQLARFLFLRQAWRLVIRDGDTDWAKQGAGQQAAEGPGAGLQEALRRLRDTNVDLEDLTMVVRAMQWNLLAGLLYLLDDPGDLEPECRDVAWRLFQVDDEDNPLAVLGGLHESLLETEPS
jgi:hypothetical protein